MPRTPQNDVFNDDPFTSSDEDPSLASGPAMDTDYSTSSEQLVNKETIAVNRTKRLVYGALLATAIGVGALTYILATKTESDSFTRDVSVRTLLDVRESYWLLDLSLYLTNPPYPTSTLPFFPVVSRLCGRNHWKGGRQLKTAIWTSGELWYHHYQFCGSHIHHGVAVCHHS